MSKQGALQGDKQGALQGADRADQVCMGLSYALTPEPGRVGGGVEVELVASKGATVTCDTGLPLHVTQGYRYM